MYSNYDSHEVMHISKIVLARAGEVQLTNRSQYKYPPTHSLRGPCFHPQPELLWLLVDHQTELQLPV